MNDKPIGGTKYIFDFDDTLFNSRDFKQHIFRVIETETGISHQVAAEYYLKVRGGEFSLKEFIAELLAMPKSDIGKLPMFDFGRLEMLAATPPRSPRGLAAEALPIYDEIIRECPRFVNQELVGLLRSLRPADRFLVSYGEAEYNLDKIRQSGLSEFFPSENIYIVQGSKATVISEICRRFPDEKIEFIDNRPDFIEEVKKENLPNLEIRAYRRFS